jgi:methionyl-tRNA synthetase
MDGSVSDINWNEMSEISLKPDHKIGKVEPLFAKIESSVIDEQKSKLGD